MYHISCTIYIMYHVSYMYHVQLNEVKGTVRLKGLVSGHCDRCISGKIVQCNDFNYRVKVCIRFKGNVNRFLLLQNCTSKYHDVHCATVSSATR